MYVFPAGRTASFLLSLSLLGLLAGCGGKSSAPTGTPTVIVPTDIGIEQMFGDIRTRIVGTAQ